MKSMPRLVLIIIFLIQYGQFRFFTIKNQRFYDPEGSEIIFHGINIVQKNPPYYKLQFGDEQFKRLKSWGLNGIRLGVMWDGVEPQQGKYNDTYLQIMLDFVNKAGKYGIYTLIQFHQDLFSSLFCSDGVPSWAIKNSSKNWNFPYPLKILQNQTQCGGRAHWQQLYLSYAINQAFYQLYTNVNQLRDRFVGYWKQIAATFKDNPYVIGYQLLNQPWPGNMYRQPTIMIPGLSQKTYLQQFYDIVSTQIRSIDQQNICIEPVTWLNAVPSGFQHAPGGQQHANTSMLCFHYYQPTVLNMDMFLYARKLDMTRLKIGGMITEFQGLTQGQLVHSQLLNKCDKLSISWFAWEYRNTLVPFILKRTYAQKIAGQKQYQNYDNITKQYKLRYKSNNNNNNNSESETIIFFNYDHYLYGIQNDTDYQYNLTTKRKVEFDRPIDIESELNMKITIIPEVKYQITENMFIRIKAKDIGGDGKIVIVKIQRKVQYPRNIQVTQPRNKNENVEVTQMLQKSGILQKLQKYNNHQQTEFELSNIKRQNQNQAAFEFYKIKTHSIRL